MSYPDYQSWMLQATWALQVVVDVHNYATEDIM